ncbi:T9SS type A sorting domain-containing protein [Rufibacter sp. H-1]|uniref:T9SS type A sorting domain-containing protein n=1 Tax=Rufibacter sediminis TaxID=2762756 RepID=A0ABR6VNX2_9BACT|nr:T9SS type A sorting domain-containing protein [Rufibacter sediminis]MBC3538620.1 T9SS type A sorting domain-containing protein [Rufibacter sediminis]
MLILFCFAGQAQAQCAGSNGCFDFKLVSATASGSNTKLTFSVKVNCDKDLSNVAFELPSGQRASAPMGKKYNYTVENTTNNPFYSVKFEGKGINGYKKGVEDVFSYEVNTAAFSKMKSMRIQAKAGQNVGTFSFNPQNCAPANNGGGNSGDGNNGGNNGNNGNNGNGNNGGGNGNGGNNGGDNCKDSQPRPIEGPTSPCPGEIVEYTIRNEYTSYAWDVPRAQEGKAPIGWEIVSGQGTNKVRVRVGMKNGTMKVTVNHAECGTKVATLPVKPGNALAVSIEGDSKYCAGDVLVFKASAGKTNGNGNGNGKNKSYDFAWDVPAGWAIVSGQGTSTLIVKAGTAAGDVSVTVASNAKKNKAICEAGEAVIAVTPKPNCSPCAKPNLDVEAPTVVCASGDKIYKFAVENRDPSGRMKYDFFLPEEFQVVSQGYGYVNIKVNNAKPDSTLFVTVIAVNANNCGAEAVCLPVQVEDCPTGPCTKPTVSLEAPASICNLANEPTTITVGQVQAGVTYTFDLPEGFLVLEESNGSVTFVAVLEEAQLEQPYTVRVTATNDCGSAVAEQQIFVEDCGNGNPLPVTLTRFGGVSRNGGVELTWSTASEINNDRFEIERSANGKDFSKVGEVKGNGNSATLNNYAFTDHAAAAGTVYYRLRQVDFDGAFEYSKVISVSHATGAVAQAAINVYPNPVTNGRVAVRFQEQVSGGATIRLSDMSGRVLHTQELSSVNSEVDMNLSGMNIRAGIYLLSVTANGRSTTQRIVVR